MTIPIPGFRTAAQVDDNCKAMQYGPLSPEQFQEVEQIMGRRA
jgi:aryl-alcohol dehydrogenase-like predicted oxidoreductase